MLTRVNAVKTVLEQNTTVDKHLLAIEGVIATEKNDSKQKKNLGHLVVRK
jgi:hypothetical protein